MLRQKDAVQMWQHLLPLVRKAGSAILEVYESGLTEVEFKADASPVTQADFAANRVLVEGLAGLMEDCPVVSEEDEASAVHRSGSGRFWLLDPLDGTREFLARNGEFTVNVALIEDGRSVLGVVFAPVLDALYWGGPGLGAFKSVKGVTEAIGVQANSDQGVCRVLASKSHLNEETLAFIQRLGDVVLIQAGSSLKFCRVAEGAADIYPRLSPTCEWDTAAAQAVLEGAGGRVLDMNGEPLRYGKPDVLNPSFVAFGVYALPYSVQLL